MRPRDIALFVIDQISGEHRLLPNSVERAKVLDLVDLHYKNCNIEQVTMGTMMANNMVSWTNFAPRQKCFYQLPQPQIVGMMMPRKQRSNIVALEKVKERYPEMAEVVDARIPVIQERIKSWADPAARRDEAMVRKLAQIWGMVILPSSI